MPLALLLYSSSGLAGRLQKDKHYTWAAKESNLLFCSQWHIYVFLYPLATSWSSLLTPQCQKTRANFPNTKHTKSVRYVEENSNWYFGYCTWQQGELIYSESKALLISERCENFLLWPLKSCPYLPSGIGSVREKDWRNVVESESADLKWHAATTRSVKRLHMTWVLRSDRDGYHWGWVAKSAGSTGLLS